MLEQRYKSWSGQQAALAELQVLLEWLMKNPINSPQCTREELQKKQHEVDNITQRCEKEVG